MTMRITILGAGFIGQNLVRYFLKQGFDVKVLDLIICPDEFKDKVDWMHGSFTSSQNIEEAVEDTDILFHLISSTVPGDQVDENEEIIINVTQTNNLLRACINEGVKRVVFISSASVYGIQKTTPIPETATTDPISSHGIQKLTIEKYLQFYQHEHGLECKIMRLSNPYGPGQDIYGRQGFIAMTIGRIIKNEPIIIRGNGESIRDYIYIDDVIEACAKMALVDSKETVYNIGSGKGHSLNQVVALIRELLGRSLWVEYKGERLVDIPISIFDINRAKRELGVYPRYSLHEGLGILLKHHGLC